jgi:hypothetical protein
LNGSSSIRRSPPAEIPALAAGSGPKKSTTFDPKQGGFLKISRKIDRKMGRVTILNY